MIMIIRDQTESVNCNETKLKEENTSSDIKGVKFGAKAAKTAEAVAGPTPFNALSSEIAFDISGRLSKAFSEARLTTSSSSAETKSNKRGLKSKKNFQ